MADCEYMDKDIQDIRVLIEKLSMPDDVDPEERKAVASILASRLWTSSPRQGILQCLGFKGSKDYELVFKLPEQLRTAQTLSTVIANSKIKMHGAYALQERVALSRELCETVMSVHASGLVHKNIRPDTIIMIQQASDPQDALGSAYLTSWSMLRKATELSSRRGSDNWIENLYRHPRRQGCQPEERYHMGHDIYSLGVLLIEIALWQPFVQTSRNPPVSEVYEAKARELNLVRANGPGTIEELTMPLVIYKVMISLAETKVASSMGSSLANFILACLKCLDGKVDGLNEQDFRNSPAKAAMRFREMITLTWKAIPTT
jgi:serine/threonine protein kinase